MGTNTARGLQQKPEGAKQENIRNARTPETSGALATIVARTVWEPVMKLRTPSTAVVGMERSEMNYYEERRAVSAEGSPRRGAKAV